MFFVRVLGCLKNQDLFFLRFGRQLVGIKLMAPEGTIEISMFFWFAG